MFEWLAESKVGGQRDRGDDLGGSIAEDVCVAEEFTVLRDPEGNEFCVLRHGSTAEPWAPPT